LKAGVFLAHFFDKALARHMVKATQGTDQTEKRCLTPNLSWSLPSRQSSSPFQNPWPTTGWARIASDDPGPKCCSSTKDGARRRYPEEDFPVPPLLLTIDQAADMLAIRRSMVYDLMSRGELESCKLGKKCRRIPYEAAVDYVRRLRDGDGRPGPHPRPRQSDAWHSGGRLDPSAADLDTARAWEPPSHEMSSLDDVRRGGMSV
jgi:excisionase family DNA binding protein